MQYLTIVLELIQSRPALHTQLRQRKQLLATVEQKATELKTIHQAWVSELHLSRPGSHSDQIRSEALELALAELDLPPESDESPETGSAPPD